MCISANTRLVVTKRPRFVIRGAVVDTRLAMMRLLGNEGSEPSRRVEEHVGHFPDFRRDQ